MNAAQILWAGFGKVILKQLMKSHAKFYQEHQQQPISSSTSSATPSSLEPTSSTSSGVSSFTMAGQGQGTTRSFSSRNPTLSRVLPEVISSWFALAMIGHRVGRELAVVSWGTNARKADTRSLQISSPTSPRWLANLDKLWLSPEDMQSADIMMDLEPSRGRPSRFLGRIRLPDGLFPRREARLRQQRHQGFVASADAAAIAPPEASVSTLATLTASNGGMPSLQDHASLPTKTLLPSQPPLGHPEIPMIASINSTTVHQAITAILSSFSSFSTRGTSSLSLLEPLMNHQNHPLLKSSLSALHSRHPQEVILFSGTCTRSGFLIFLPSMAHHTLDFSDMILDGPAGMVSSSTHADLQDSEDTVTATKTEYRPRPRHPRQKLEKRRKATGGFENDDDDLVIVLFEEDEPQPISSWSITLGFPETDIHIAAAAAAKEDDGMDESDHDDREATTIIPAILSLPYSYTSPSSLSHPSTETSKSSIVSTLRSNILSSTPIATFKNLLTSQDPSPPQQKKPVQKRMGRWYWSGIEWDHGTAILRHWISVKVSTPTSPSLSLKQQPTNSNPDQNNPYNTTRMAFTTIDRPSSHSSSKDTPSNSKDKSEKDHHFLSRILSRYAFKMWLILFDHTLETTMHSRLTPKIISNDKDSINDDADYYDTRSGHVWNSTRAIWDTEPRIVVLLRDLNKINSLICRK